jgi:DNA polymerase/3'-5' exonuclease PolX
MNNHELSLQLRNRARQMERERRNLFQVRAYRQAAATIDPMERPLEDVLNQEGLEGLEAIPGIGPHIAYSLEGLLRDGVFRTLGGAERGTPPDRLLMSVPGVGPHLARRLQDELHITSLEQLDQAARDGRLQRVGVGDKRLRGIQDALAVRLGRFLPTPRFATSAVVPDVPVG